MAVGVVGAGDAEVHGGVHRDGLQRVGGRVDAAVHGGEVLVEQRHGAHHGGRGHRGAAEIAVDVVLSRVVGVEAGRDEAGAVGHQVGLDAAVVNRTRGTGHGDVHAVVRQVAHGDVVLGAPGAVDRVVVASVGSEDAVAVAPAVAVVVVVARRVADHEAGVVDGDVPSARLALVASEQVGVRGVVAVRVGDAPRVVGGGDALVGEGVGHLGGHGPHVGLVGVAEQVGGEGHAHAGGVVRPARHDGAGHVRGVVSGGVRLDDGDARRQVLVGGQRVAALPLADVDGRAVQEVGRALDVVDVGHGGRVDVVVASRRRHRLDQQDERAVGHAVELLVGALHHKAGVEQQARAVGHREAGLVGHHEGRIKRHVVVELDDGRHAVVPREGMGADRPCPQLGAQAVGAVQLGRAPVEGVRRQGLEALLRHGGQVGDRTVSLVELDSRAGEADAVLLAQRARELDEQPGGAGIEIRDGGARGEDEPRTDVHEIGLVVRGGCRPLRVLQFLRERLGTGVRQHDLVRHGLCVRVGGEEGRNHHHSRKVAHPPSQAASRRHNPAFGPIGPRRNGTHHHFSLLDGYVGRLKPPAEARKGGCRPSCSRSRTKRAPSGVVAV